MSPARQHRERLAARVAGPDTFPAIASVEPGGQPAPPAPAITPAAGHRTALAMAAPAASGGDRRADQAADQIMLRLRHDLRRLKEIKSIEAKVAAKRDMLPDYAAWCDHVLACGRARVGGKLGSIGAEDVLPTIMVWLIDTGAWPRALELAGHVLRFGVTMPARYQRDASALLVEEVADAALKIQARGEAFPLAVLEEVAELTAGADMHDEIRAKLMKATGIELDRAAGVEAEAGREALPLMCRALEALHRAQELHPRVGVKDRIKRLEKARAAPADQRQAGAQPAA